MALQIAHYQRKLERYAASDEGDKLLYVIHKLKYINITVGHLEKTGVGRDVNALRHREGLVGEKARALVNKWKEMVTSDNKKKSSSDKKGGDDKRKENKDLNYSNREKNKKSESKHSDKPGDKSSDKLSDKLNDKQNGKHSDRYSEKSSDKHNDKHNDKHKSGESSHRGADSRQSSGADIKKSSRKDHDSETKDKKKYSDKKEDGNKKNKERSLDREKDKEKKKKSKRSSPDLFEQKLMGSIDSSQKKQNKKRKRERDYEREDSEEESTPSTSKRSLSSPQSIPDPKKPRLLNMIPLSKLPDLHLPDVTEASLLPDISSNYKPLPRMSYKDDPLNLPKLSDEELLSQMMSSKTGRGRKVYSGNSKGLDHVPSLYESCIRCLQENIDSLEATGGIPWEILKPVLERCTWRQLFKLENFNPYLLDDTDALWEKYCRRDFRTKEKMELESYREMYLRCFDEREAKFLSLTENLQKKQVGRANAKSSTKVAFIGTLAKAPKYVQRAQAKYGTAISPARLLKPASASGSWVREAPSGVREDKAVRKLAMENVIRTERANAGPKLTQAQKKRKIAPMMAKTKMFYKKAFRR